MKNVIMEKEKRANNFMKRVNEKWGDHFSFEKMEYVDYGKTKIAFICKKHGEILSTPRKLLDNGCKKCKRGYEKLIQKDNFMKRISSHPDIENLDLSKVTEFVSDQCIEVLCKKHGNFHVFVNQLLYSHQRCTGCVKEEAQFNFIEKSKEIHNNKFDYSLVKYIGNNKKVEIICPIHGVFLQTPQHHLKGGCNQCSFYNRFLTKDEFIEKSNSVHGLKYDYSLVNYVNNRTKVAIKCENGHIFEQLPFSHMQGKGCETCYYDKLRIKNKEEFIEKCKSLYDDTYCYDNINYFNNDTKLDLYCNIHKCTSSRTPFQIIRGQTCNMCTTVSKGEEKIKNILVEKKINFQTQKIFKECRNIYPLRFDFYLLDYDLCIEYNGIQHYESLEFFGGDEKLRYTQNNDTIKSNYCKDNNIKLEIIRFDENIEDRFLYIYENIILQTKEVRV
jgi:hypothetical protein